MPATSVPTTTPPAPAAVSPRRGLPAPRAAARVAGSGLLLMAVLAAVANFGVLEQVLTPGDAARIAADIAARPGAVVAATVAMGAVALLDVVVALALHVLLRPGAPRLSAVAAGLRVVYAAVLAVAVVRLAAVPGLVGEPEAALRAAEDFRRTWDAGLLLFGAHLLVLAAVSYRSGVVPRWLVALLALAGAGYVVDAVSVLVAPDRPLATAQVLFVGEVAFLAWLLVAGGRRPVVRR